MKITPKQEKEQQAEMKRLNKELKEHPAQFLKFRPITLRLDNDELLSWYPLAIDSIEINKNYIRINDEVIEKSDCYYCHWDYFSNELKRMFIC